jgi:hypothetical protein
MFGVECAWRKDSEWYFKVSTKAIIAGPEQSKMLNKRQGGGVSLKGQYYTF